MLTPEKILAKYLKAISIGEKPIEKARVELAQLPQFNPEHTFYYLDHSHKGYLCLNDIFQFLKYSFSNYRKNNLSVTKEDCSEIMRTYDTTHSQSLYYQDFLIFVLPTKAAKLTSNVLKRGKNEKSPLPFQVLNNLLNLFKAELGMWRELRILYEDLRSRPDFGLYHMFQFMDPDCTYYLSLDKVHSFMNLQGEKLTRDEISSVLRRLDSNHDGKTSYIDFKYSISGSDKELSLSEPHIKQIEKHIYKTSEIPPQKVTSLIGKYAPISMEEKDVRRVQYETYPEENDSYEIKRKHVRFAKESPGKYTESTIEERYSSIYKTPDLREEKKMRRTPGTAYTASESPEGRYREYSPMKESSKYASQYSEWEADLARLFKTQIIIDSEVETAKADLCSKPDFTLSNAFHFFDINNTGSLTLYELKVGFNKLSVNYSNESAMLLMRRYDLDTNGKLNFYEFSKMLSPVIAAPLPGVKAAEITDNHIEFDRDTKRAIIETLEAILKAETMAENLRDRSKEITANLQDAFSKCDTEMKGYLTKKDIHDFMMKHGIDITSVNGSLLMNRYDKDLDERITMKEVRFELMIVRQ